MEVPVRFRKFSGSAMAETCTVQSLSGYISYVHAVCQ